MIVKLRCALIIGCALFVCWIAPVEGVFSAEINKNPAPPVSLSEVVLFGVRPICDLDPSRYPEDSRSCVASYLKAVPEASPLRKCPPPPAQDQAAVGRGDHAADPRIRVRQADCLPGQPQGFLHVSLLRFHCGLFCRMPALP